MIRCLCNLECTVISSYTCGHDLGHDSDMSKSVTRCHSQHLDCTLFNDCCSRLLPVRGRMPFLHVQSLRHDTLCPRLPRAKHLKGQNIELRPCMRSWGLILVGVQASALVQGSHGSWTDQSTCRRRNGTGWGCEQTNGLGEFWYTIVRVRRAV